MSNNPKLLQDYGNKIAIQTLTMLKYKLDTYADEHCSGDDINIYDVFKVIDMCIEKLENSEQ